MACAWAESHGLGHLPLDLKHTYAGRSSRSGGQQAIRVPVPWSKSNGHVIVLSAAEVAVEWEEVQHLSSLVRSELPDRQLRAEAARGYFRLTVVTAPGEVGEWDDYIEGLTALRNSAAKHPRAWSVIRESAPWGREVDQLMAHGCTPDPQWAGRLQGGSPAAAGGAVVIALTKRGMEQPYGDWPQPGQTRPSPRGLALTRNAQHRREIARQGAAEFATLPTLAQALGLGGEGPTTTPTP
ncbi:hypothetical protein [Streptomyces lydicus]|uniref:hypothetical protein n=1 Tax=Streptomyces lydicus TaxID=47763 RepID=UPI001013C21B|nr:hypothetical protein [Streptomyces lydicus]MCZ1012169.1 hypothetical protein [Streptomyces lydicus]